MHGFKRRNGVITTIEVCGREGFVFDFIANHDGDGIPCPVPDTVLSLEKKGLIRVSKTYPTDIKVRCFLTDLGKIVFEQLNKGEK